MTVTDIPAGAPAESRRGGLGAWLTTTDHKRIGLLYIGTSLVFFVVAAGIAMLMRTQTMRPGQHVLSAEAYDQAFSVHGTTMVFLFGMPILAGFANYLIPLMIGARDMAFPRLNAFGYWVYAFAGVLFYSSFAFGGALDTGWFSYAPLTENAFSPHDGVTFWIVALVLLGASSMAGAVNFIMTMNRLRAPGMTWRRMPMFAIATYINSFLVLFAIPSLTASLGMLYMDRLHGTMFYNAARGGDPIIWQHLFWFFGHPEVYILILPVFGMISEVTPVFSRKPLFGRSTMIIMLAVIGFLGFTVWAHHMFAAGLPNTFNLLMAASSMLIAIPTGVKIFNWLGTMWGGALRFKTSLLFVCGMIALFTVGGLTGVSQVVVPFDWQVEDTYYIVAHLHNVLFAGTVFGVMAGLYYWFPKMTGRLLSERLGRVHFSLMTVGFLVTFMPMYAAGLMGMPRRVWTYSSDVGWGGLNLVSALGAYVIGVSIVVFIVNIVRSRRHGELAGDDPWDAWTLEWTTSSPPPPYNFATLPVVTSERPLWDRKHDAGADAPASPPVAGAAAAELEAVHGTSLPLFAALAATVVGIGLLSTWVVILIGVVALLVVTAVWMATRFPDQRFPDDPPHRFTPWGAGMLVFLGSEVILFAGLIYADVHLKIHDSLPTDPHRPVSTLVLVNTVVLLSSGVLAHYALTTRRAGRLRLSRWLLVLTILFGAAFLGGQAWEYTHAAFGLRDGVVGSTFYTLTGLHGAHVTVGILLLVYLLVHTWRQRRDAAASGAAASGAGAGGGQAAAGTLGLAEAGTYYWHFVDAAWVAIFIVVYLL